MAWYFLRAGQSNARAIETLNRLISDLTSLRGSLQSNPEQAANQYLLWTEAAELHLSELLVSRAVIDALQSERYWRIRAVTVSAVRPHPLIQAEISTQERSLREIRGQLDHYRSLVGVAEDERVLVCDTNVYVHGRQFHELAWNELFSEKRVRIVMPLVVVDELDCLKDRGIRAAGGVLRDLDRLLKPGAALEKVQIRPNVSLQLVDEPGGHERLRGQDDEIVRQAAYFHSLSDHRLTVMTRDRGMRVRAEAAGLDGRALPAEYERKREVEEVDAAV